jgi:hypothetical protein
MAKKIRSTATTPNPAPAAPQATDVDAAKVKLARKLFSICGAAPAAAAMLTAEERQEAIDLCYDARGQLVEDARVRFTGWWQARHRASVEAETAKLVQTTRARLSERGRQQALTAMGASNTEPKS